MRGTTFGRASRGTGQPATGSLLPAAARPLAVAMVAVCGLVTVLQGLWLRHGMETGWVDGSVDARVRAALGGHRALLSVLVWPGEPLPATAIASALVLAGILRRRYREAALVAISILLATALTELVLKPLIGRTPWGDPFPSGHVTSVTALAAAVTVLVTRMPATAPRVLRPAAVCAVFLTAAAVAIGVIGANMHHFSDTVGGAAVGTGTVLLVALTLDLLCGRAPRRRREVPEPAELPGETGLSPRVLRRR